MLIAPPTPVFAGPRAQSLTFPNKGLSALGATAPTWNSVEFGADAQSGRTCGLLITAEDFTFSEFVEVNSASWGGVSFVRQERITALNGGLSLYAAIWTATVPTGDSGDIVLSMNRTCDSIGVTTFVTTGLGSPTKVDGNNRAASSSSTIVLSPFSVPSDGTVVGIAAGDGYNIPFTSLSGSVNGAVTEQSDLVIENDHRQAVYGKDDTTSASSETFTFTRSSAGYWVAAAASFG